MLVNILPLKRLRSGCACCASAEVPKQKSPKYRKIFLIDSSRGLRTSPERSSGTQTPPSWWRVGGSVLLRHGPKHVPFLATPAIYDFGGRRPRRYRAPLRVTPLTASLVATIPFAIASRTQPAAYPSG